MSAEEHRKSFCIPAGCLQSWTVVGTALNYCRTDDVPTDRSHGADRGCLQWLSPLFLAKTNTDSLQSDPAAPVGGCPSFVAVSNSLWCYWEGELAVSWGFPANIQVILL